MHLIRKAVDLVFDNISHPRHQDEIALTLRDSLAVAHDLVAYNTPTLQDQRLVEASILTGVGICLLYTEPSAEPPTAQLFDSPMNQFPERVVTTRNVFTWYSANDPHGVAHNETLTAASVYEQLRNLVDKLPVAPKCLPALVTLDDVLSWPTARRYIPDILKDVARTYIVEACCKTLAVNNAFSTEKVVISGLGSLRPISQWAWSWDDSTHYHVPTGMPDYTVLVTSRNAMQIVVNGGNHVLLARRPVWRLDLL